MTTIEQKARRICEQEKLQYLSHEYYLEHFYPLWIAVKDEYGQRFEIKRMLSEVQ